MQRSIPLALVALILAPCVNPVAAAGKVRLEDLLPQMTELSRLAEYPDPPYVARQFSSYDRASERPGTENWFANGDRGFMLFDGMLKQDTPYFNSGPKRGQTADGILAAGTRVGLAPTHKPIDGYVWAYATAADGRPPGDKTPQGYIARSAITMDPQGHVLADIEGPGCVVRIWSANPKAAGNVRIYLDRAEKPALEAPLQTLLAGKWKATVDGKEMTPFPDPIACERSRGFNLYFPIAYARHCKITVDRPNIYYHVDYRTYPRGTEVETFRLEALAKLPRQLHDVVAGLRLPVDRKLSSTTGSAKSASIKLDPGKTCRLAFEGPLAIHSISARLGAAHDASGSTVAPAEAWRNLMLVVTFDGAAHPQIWCPLGDFFATSPGFQSYHSLPFDVGPSYSPQSMCSWWTMPFQKSAVLEVRNLGKQAFLVELNATAGKYPWSNRSMHFHAKWRSEVLKTRPFRDWNFCDLKGKGVFVGDMLSLMNPVKAWWGEGDEKIFVDGEPFPSWFGTGTEDYYAYAWSDPKPFQHAYHNQTRCDGPGNRGNTSVNRFHILDAIPFTRSFRFDMELWHWTPNIEIPYAATSYWYARPGASDDFIAPDPLALQTVPTPPLAYRIRGALEGEKLRILNKSGDFDAGAQDMSPFDGKWSGESHLWGRPAKAGEWVDLELPVAAGGRYQVLVFLTKARDYGIVRFYLDGRPLGRKIDGFHADGVISSGRIDLGTVNLAKGTATLRVEVVGTNPQSDGLRYMWGLDCVVLKKASD